MTRFLDLVDDVVLIIAQDFIHERDLNSLSRINRHFHALLDPVLYSQHVRSHGGWALSWAAQYDRVNTARKLFAVGADVQLRTIRENVLPPIATAAKHGSLEMVKVLLTMEGVDPNWEGDDPQGSCLSFAAGEGHTEVVQLLLADKRVNPKKPPHGENWTAFENAARKGHVDVVKLLLCDDRVDVSKVDQDGLPILSYAAMPSRDNTECIRLLLADARIDRSITDSEGKTALGRAVTEGCHEANIQALLDAGFDPNHQDASGDVPLTNTLDWLPDRPNRIKALLRAPTVDPNIRNNQGHTPLMKAAKDCWADMVSCLSQDKRVLPNLATNRGMTALMYAAEGITTSITMIERHPPVQESAPVLVIRSLLSMPDIDVNLADDDKMTALHHAIESSNRDGIARELIRDKRVDLEKKEIVGRAAVVRAAARGAHRIIEMLWETGRCAIDEQDYEGRNALSYAAEFGRVAAVEVLLRIEEDEGLNLMLPDKLKRDPWWYASHKGRDGVVHLLEKRKI